MNLKKHEETELRYIIIKKLKISDKGKILDRERSNMYIKTKIRMTAYFLSQII